MTDVAHGRPRMRWRCGACVAARRRPRGAGVGVDPSSGSSARRPGHRPAAWRQAADAVAAHLGPAAVGVVQLHPRRRRRRRPGSPDDQAVGADAAVAVARRRAARSLVDRRSVASRSSRTRKSLPSPWCLVSRMRAPCARVGSTRRLGGRPSTRPATSASGSSAGASTQRDARVAPEPPLLAAGEAAGAGARRASTRLVQAARRRRGGRAAPCSRAPGGPCATARPGRRARRADLVEEPGGELVGVPAPRCGRRAPAAVAAQPDEGERRRRVGRRGPGRSDENGRPLPRVTSRARTTRRRLRRLHAGGRGRVEPGEAARAGRSVSSSASSSARTSGNRPGMSRSSTTARRYSAGAADEEGRAARGPRCRRARRRGRPGTRRRRSPRGIDEVEQVVADLGPLGRGRLGGADVHAPVDLHRVDGDDLASRRVGRRRAAGRGPTCPRRSAPTTRGVPRGRRSLTRRRRGCGSGAVATATTSTQLAARGGGARRR